VVDFTARLGTFKRRLTILHENDITHVHAMLLSELEHESALTLQTRWILSLQDMFWYLIVNICSLLILVEESEIPAEKPAAHVPQTALQPAFPQRSLQG
jgi:hypothetical protein